MWVNIKFQPFCIHITYEEYLFIIANFLTSVPFCNKALKFNAKCVRANKKSQIFIYLCVFCSNEHESINNNCHNVWSGENEDHYEHNDYVTESWKCDKVLICRAHDIINDEKMKAKNFRLVQSRKVMCGSQMSEYSVEKHVKIIYYFLLHKSFHTCKPTIVMWSFLFLIKCFWK